MTKRDFTTLISELSEKERKSVQKWIGKVWHNGEWWDETAWHQYACDHEDGLGTRGSGPEFTTPPTTPLRGIPVDLSAIVDGMEPRLREMIGANIALQMNLERDGLWVKADPAQIEQVVTNLITNARDAMPQGGVITVETSRVNVGPDLVRRVVSAAADFDVWGPASGPAFDGNCVHISEGNYVRLLVRDTGIGMDADTKHLVFEPFWTTKALGRGEGLGLSTVYGIVRSCGGEILVESEPGRGSCFEIYLPEVAAPVGQRED